MEEYNKYAVKCFKDEAEAILELIPQLTEDFSKAVELILNSKGRFIITGVGKSGHVGAKIAATLASTGTPSFFVNPLDAYHGDLGMFTSDDVVMAISYSGNTDELLRFLPLLIDRRIPIIGVSGNPQSLLAQYSTCHLNIKVKREADPNNLAPTSSTTATLAMGDAIACALIEARNFKPMDFAQFHPGGSLGKRLLTRVKDVMHKDNLPTLSPETKMSEALVTISKGKLGLAVVLEGHTIVGLVTSGDIRRAFQKYEADSFYLSAKDIMTVNPKVVHDTCSLSKAEELFKTYNVHTLVVVSDNNEFVGFVDFKDCTL